MTQSRSLPGFETPTVGFDEPFEMLGACHDRVRRTLRLLVRLRTHLTAHGTDQMAHQAAKDIVRYFQIAAPMHHDDEERHVVPLLQGSANAELIAVADRLLADHERMRSAWAMLEPLLTQVVSNCLPDGPAFSSAIDVFTTLYDGHLALEEGLAFPNAQRLCAFRGPSALVAMAEEMARRRFVGKPNKTCRVSA